MCVKNIVKTAAAFVAMIFALTCLAKMFLLESATAHPAGYSNYITWTTQCGLLLLAVGASYVLFCGEDEVKTVTGQQDSGQ